MKIASEKERKAAIDKAQSELDFWKGVADELAKRNGTTAENVAQQADTADEALTATDVAPNDESTGVTTTTTTTTPTADTETATDTATPQKAVSDNRDSANQSSKQAGSVKDAGNQAAGGVQDVDKVLEKEPKPTEEDTPPEANGVIVDDVEAEMAQIEADAKANGTYMKAPNGKRSKLTPRQWAQVRTKAFKDWFGDWEKRSRIEKLRKSESAFISGKEIEVTDDYKQNKKNALEYGKKLQREYTNADTGVSVQLQRGRKNGGINEVLQHNYKDDSHILSVAAIPQIIEKSIYIDREPNKDTTKNPDVVEYQHFVGGLKIGGEDYTVHSLEAVDKHGNRYYDHNLTHIEKTKLLDSIERQAVKGQGFDTTSGTEPTTLIATNVRNF